MLKAIFLAIFDVDEGPKVLHQVPASSITASPSTPSIPLLHFPPIANTLIPHPTLCNNGLLQLAISHHRILSYPQCLENPAYPRNAYTFNFCLVLPADADFTSYIPVTRKLNTLFRTLELHSHFLSSDPSPPNTGKIYALCETLLEDLNNYSEAMIPIDASNTLNIKLFPTYPPPPPLHPHHVPLATVNLSSLTDSNWDLTMLLILPHINGINSVKQIALLADADYKLVKKSLRHLLYYGCILLLDIFSFSAIYACTADISHLIDSPETQAECHRYVILPPTSPSPSNPTNSTNSNPTTTPPPPLSPTDLPPLYLSLHQSLPVRAFLADRPHLASQLDLRRFFTFGVIKGFLYRVHKYAFAAKKQQGRRMRWVSREESEGGGREGGGTGTGDGGAGGGARGGGGAKGKEQADDKRRGREGDKELERFLDGTHCFDEICTELMISEKELGQRLKARGDVQIICR